MKILCWNINHRTCEKSIHYSALDLIRLTSPDLLILNEFVDGETRNSFKSSMVTQGLQFHLTSPKLGRHNQIFVASRFEIMGLSPIGQVPISAMRSNMCFFRILPEFCVLAVRVPAFKKLTERQNAWTYYLNEISLFKPNMIIGDLNVDPNDKENNFLVDITKAGYRHIAIPGASYWTLTGKPRSLDHVFLGLGHTAEAKYITDLNSHTIVGNSGSFASDHAAILVNLKP